MPFSSLSSKSLTLKTMYIHFDVFPDVGISKPRLKIVSNRSCFNRSSTQHPTRNCAPCHFVDYARWVPIQTFYYLYPGS
jgi:hypothetical protein